MDLCQPLRSNMYFQGKFLRSHKMFMNSVRIGVNFSDDELLEMVQEADIDGDQHVSFEEFSNIFNEG